MGGGSEFKYKEHLLITMEFSKPEAILGSIQQRFPYVEITYVRMKDGKAADSDVDLKSLYTSATILSTLAHLPDKAEDVPNLKFIHLFSAGVDHYLNHPLYTSSTIPFTTSSGIHGPPISEWVIGTSLAFSKQLYLMHTWQQAHQYGGPSGPSGRHALDTTTDWVGKRIGIAGYGSIGRQIARVFTAMGAQVIAYTASPRPTPESRKDKGYIIPGTGDPDGQWPIAWYSGTSQSDLHAFLSTNLDALVISLPLTPATTHLFRAAEFNILHSSSTKGCFLINIARGKIINQHDLVQALNDDKLRGAALDVTDPEPLPDDDPLWSAKNVVITPHISALGTEYMGRAYDVLATNLGRLERGEGLVNEVRRGRGY